MDEQARRCVACGKDVLPSEADITPNGLRCTRCTVNSQIAGHIAGGAALSGVSLLGGSTSSGLSDDAVEAVLDVVCEIIDGITDS